jgi:hypothetical protein
LVKYHVNKAKQCSKESRRANMKTVDLSKVLEMLVNEEQSEASGLLHEWFVERSKQVHEELMSEDNTLSQDIEDDQDAIQAEEFYSEDEADDAEPGAEELDGDIEVGDEVAGDDEMDGPELPAEASIADTIEDLEAVMARLKSEFAEITGADVASDDLGDGDLDDDFGDEEVDEAFDASANDHEFTKREPKFAQSIMSQYKMGAEDGELPAFALPNGVDVEGGWIMASGAIEMDDQQISATIAKNIGLNPTAIADKIGKIQLPNGKNAIYAAFVIGGDQMGESSVNEAFDAKANDHVFTKREPKFAAAIMDQYNYGTEDGELPHFTLDNGVDVEGGWILASGAIGMNDQQITATIAKNIGLNPTAIADKIGKVKLANGMNAIYAAFVIGGDQMKDGHVDEAFDPVANDHVFTRREPKFAKEIMDQYNYGTEDGRLPHFTLDNGVDVEGGWFLASAAIGMNDQQIATTIAKQIGLNPTAIADKVGRVKLANGMNAVYAAFVIGGDQMKDGHVDESEDDFADLEESWTLEPVADPKLNGGKEIGAAGAKVSLNDKSPLPEHDADARVGGNAVEIKSDHHTGYEREAAPSVNARPLLKNQVKKSTDNRTKVSKEGDKSAQLNSNAGFGSDSPKSPIGGGTTDLRGSNFKRK